MSTKICTTPTCTQINPQPYSQFHKKKNTFDGLSYTCKSCCKKRGNKYYREGNGLNNSLKFKYGITEKEYDIMLDIQKNRCVLCLRHNKEFKHRFSVDHDHKTGRVRSLLCGPCNQALGLMKDNPDLFRRAADYLEYHFEPPIPYVARLVDGIYVKEDRDDHLPALDRSAVPKLNI